MHFLGLQSFWSLLGFIYMLDLYLMHFLTVFCLNMKFAICAMFDAPFFSFTALLRMMVLWWFLIIKIYLIYLKACMNPLASLKHLDGKRKCFLAMLVSWTFVTSFVSLPCKKKIFQTTTQMWVSTCFVSRWPKIYEFLSQTTCKPLSGKHGTRALAQRTLDLQHLSVWILRATHAKEKERVKTWSTTPES